MKQMFKMLFMVLLIVLISISSVQAYDVNKDVTNLGPAAYDIAVILKGTEGIYNHYDGYHSGDKIGWFSWFTCDEYNDDTMLHWQSFYDNNDKTIDTNQTIHIGWSTDDHSGSVKDMYWTDKQGQKIVGSVITNIVPDWERNPEGEIIFNWTHGFNIQTPIEIIDVNFAALPLPVLLENLNTENAALNAQMAPIPGGGHLILMPGQLVSLQIPVAVPANFAIVLRYQVVAPGTEGRSLDYIQFATL
ncbi:MAG: hypothetical protein MUF15_18795 [Acidobacteria bacterium]|nr:hypothetical protein [Acidobacteriota bacterium]